MLFNAKSSVNYTADTTTINGAEAPRLLVFNTATVLDVNPGFYYRDGTQWVDLASGIWSCNQ
ncbi:MAG: hypothetical protein HRT68_03790 [Flavobacteriaceae bacterium]|nr:hypothetical protein [Flavobacteriaceae bacterium]